MRLDGPATPIEAIADEIINPLTCKHKNIDFDRMHSGKFAPANDFMLVYDILYIGPPREQPHFHPASRVVRAGSITLLETELEVQKNYKPTFKSQAVEIFKYSDPDFIDRTINCIDTLVMHTAKCLNTE